MQRTCAIVLAALALAAAAPALARGADAISAPSDIALFALGVTGLILGRRLARRRKRERDEEAE